MAAMQIDPARRAVSLDPRDPAFFNNPYPAYREIRAAVPVFKWEEYGYWCFARHEDVNALLARPPLRPADHCIWCRARSSAGRKYRRISQPFYAFEAHSLLETRAAGAYAHSRPGQPRLRGARHRGIAAAHRGTCP